jgi:subtilisin family serine protease
MPPANLLLARIGVLSLLICLSELPSALSHPSRGNEAGFDFIDRSADDPPGLIGEQPRTYILHLDRRQKINIQRTLNTLIGAHHHVVLGDARAQVFLTPASLHNIKQTLGEKIQAVTELSPNEKYDSLSLVELPPSIRLLVVIMSPTQDTLQSLYSLLLENQCTLESPAAASWRGEGIVAFDVSSDLVNGIVTKLACRPDVTWIEVVPEMTTSNAWGRRLVCEHEGRDSGLGDVNITGIGSVIGVVDTGIDVNHCLFRDEGRSVPFNNVNSAHRKIVYYRSYMDSTDDKEGHGTGTFNTIHYSMYYC